MYKLSIRGARATKKQQENPQTPHSMADKKDRAPFPFALICEMGMGKMTIDGFMSMSGATKAAEKLLCCWVIYKLQPAPLYVEEVAHGGIGFAHGAIRSYAKEMFKAQPQAAPLD
jgi:hypothetical protein